MLAKNSNWIDDLWALRLALGFKLALATDLVQVLLSPQALVSSSLKWALWLPPTYRVAVKT